eukprot:jgi/Undpi1/12473/HiC_scaffold_5.g02144.m1
MEEATREQQREARRQKVLARSQEGIGAAVVDHAASQDDVAPQGVSAELDHNEADPSSVPSDAAAVPEDSTKSASRLAAERRRQRILSKSTERMAKVQGDRVIHAAAAGRGESGAEGGAGGGESLDDMLDAAEEEFFGEGGAGSVAEAKPAARQQAYFKSSKGSAAGGEGGGGGDLAGGPGAAAATAQSKPTRERRGAGGAFKPSKSDGPPAKVRHINRRPAGNKAMDQQPFDMASMQSMAFAASGNFGKGAAGTTSGNASLAGGIGGSGGGKGRGVRFWAAVEGVTKTALLLLAGAGVGGLLFPEASAAGAQTKYGEEFFFVVSSYSCSAWAGVSWGGAGEGRGGTGRAVAGVGEQVGVGAGNDATPGVLDTLLSYMDYVVGWSHSLSTFVVPSYVGVGGQAACVPAIFLAVLVRLAVSSAFSVLRVGLGLPAFPSAVGKSKPGMIMGMILATMPMLGKAIAFLVLIKDIFADTTLVVAGTVLTLTVCLGWEEDSGPRTAANSVLSMFGLLTSGGDGHLKEL